MSVLQQLKHMHHRTMGRYQLLFARVDKASPSPAQGNQTVYCKAYLNHMQSWAMLDKLVIHSTTKRLLTHPELYGVFSLGVHCISKQAPCLVKSKINNAAFQMIKGTPIAVVCHLRSRALFSFCYKWAFLAASIDSLKGNTLSQAVGVDNVLVFELSQLDYASFQTIKGLELHFVTKTKS